MFARYVRSEAGGLLNGRKGEVQEGKQQHGLTTNQRPTWMSALTNNDKNHKIDSFILQMN